MRPMVSSTAAISALFSLFIAGCSMEKEFILNAEKDLLRQPLAPETVLNESDLAGLPALVRRYIIYTGALGKSRPQNFRVEFDAEMIKNTASAPMSAHSVQYNFLRLPSRYFYMTASMHGIPARVLHQYTDAKATMVVKAAFLFSVVDLSGEELSKAETVTILNDMCFFAPASLTDPRLTWKELDSLSVHVTFRNDPYIVSATLFFDTSGALVNFVSNDRPALQDDGTLKNAPWSTPVSGYRELDGRIVPGYAEAVYRYPEGDFVYGRFWVKSVSYNVRGIE